MAFCEIDGSVLEILLKYIDITVYDTFFRYHQMTFSSFVTANLERNDTNTVNDENRVYNLKQQIAVTCKYLLREAQIKEEGLAEKIQVIRMNNHTTFEEHVKDTLRALLNLNYSERIKDMFIEQILMLVMLSVKREDAMMMIRNTLIIHLPQYTPTIDGMFREVACLSLDRPSMLHWRKKFGDLIEWITSTKSTPTSSF